jgi:hypothetical protein
VLRAGVETKTTQENMQDWLQLDEGEPEFRLLTEEEIAVVIIFISTTYIIKFYTYLLPSFSLRAVFCLINPD